MILQTLELSKYYNSNMNIMKAVDGVNFLIEKNEFISIIGKSGSGKTTLLNLLAGLEEPTEGKIIIGGVDISGLSRDKLTVFRRRHMGFIFQNFNLLPMLNVMENIILPASLDNKSPDEQYLRDIIKLLEIEDKLNEFPNKLSGGQQQRVAIARALANKPALLFADEPTGNLDRATGSEVIRLLKELCTELNQTIIMVTHDLDISNGTDRRVVIEDGKIIEDKRL